MEKKSVDLHVHTCYSDGNFTPEEVVKNAVRLRLGAVAITDHDCVDGVSSAINAAAGTGLEIVPGVEMSVFVDDIEAHLLGYFIDINNARLKEFLAAFKRKRQIRIKKMLGLLSKYGIDLSFDLLKAEKDKGTIGRMNLAKALVQEGAVGSIKEAFQRYIGNGKKCYVRHEKQAYNDCIDIIKSSGGVPVLAHPGIIAARDTTCIDKFISAGIKGLEVYHPKHKPYQILKYGNIARKNNLIPTGGSDCHGINVNNSLLLGTVTVNYSIVEELKHISGAL